MYLKLSTENCKHHVVDKCGLSEEAIRDYKMHFHSLVVLPNGNSCVSTEKNERIVESLQTILTSLLGKAAMENVIISGSAAQGLKCERRTKRGDADIVLISEFPVITKEEQIEVLRPGPELGYFKIKALPKWQQFPTVVCDRESYISAESLRKLKSVWWRHELKVPVMVVSSQNDIMHFYKKMEIGSGEGVASTITWGRSFLNEEDDYTMRAFEILWQSYQENILPLADVQLAQEIMVIAEATNALIKTIVHYSASKYEKATKRANEMCDILKNEGYLNRSVAYWKKKNLTPECQVIRSEHIPCLQQICWYFATSLMSCDLEELKSEAWQKDANEGIDGSYDFVPAIQCDGFSIISTSWPARVAVKEWPKPSVVQNVLHAGFQLVPRASKSGHSDPRVSFRLSFNEAETILATSLNQVQRECFRCLKMYYYEFLETNPKLVETYHLKTILFWTLENTPEGLWREDNMAFCCITLLSNLAEALKSGYLLHYFIPGNNLFQHHDKEALEKAAQVVDSVIHDPIGKTGNVMKRILRYQSDQYTERGDKNLEANEQSLDGISELSTLTLKKSKEKFFREVEILQNYENHKDVLANISNKEYLNFKEMRNIIANKDLRQVLQFCFDILFYHRIRGGNIFWAGQDMIPIFLSLPIADSILVNIMGNFLQDQDRKSVLNIQNFIRMAAFFDNSAVLEVAEAFKDAMQNTAKTDTRASQFINVVTDHDLD